MDLCICFHQLLDEVSMTTITDDDYSNYQSNYKGKPIQAPSSLLLKVLDGVKSFLWIPENFPSARFLASLIMAPSIKISLSLLSLSVLPPSQPSHSLLIFHLYFIKYSLPKDQRVKEPHWSALQTDLAVVIHTFNPSSHVVVIETGQ